MITVSNDFRNSVKSTEREMKGYVEISYTNIDAKGNSGIVSYPSILEINGISISPNYIIDDDRKGKNYASLEQDYFRLDGTFVLPNNSYDKNPGIGYVSNDVFENDNTIPTTPFNITVNSEEKTSGLTLYFQNNIPLELQIDITSGNNTETFTDIDISSNGVAMLMFEERVIDEINIYVKDVLYLNRRIRLQEIDFGISAIYESDELISFKTIEECDRFSDTMPINECEITLGDFNGKFDMTNPKGVTQYLNENVLIKPFVGIVTEDNGIEYCTKGMYWLKSWNYNGKQATLNGQSIFGKLLDMDYTKLSSVNGQSPTIQQWLNYKAEQWGVDFEYGTIYTSEYLSSYVDDTYAKIDTKLNTLQKMAGFCGGMFNNTRDGKIKYLSALYGTLFEDIERTSINETVMKEHATITNNDPINTISVAEYIYKDPSSDLETFYENTIQSNDIVELYIPFDDYKAVQFPYTENCTVIDSNFGSSSWVYDTYIYLKIQCNGNAKVVLQGYSYKDSKTENSRRVNQVGKEIKIENDFYSSNGTANLRGFTNNYIDYQIANRPKRSIKVSFNGLPYYETGDIISVDGKKYNNYIPQYTTLITKIESEFNGSYRETIEGDVIEN